MLFQKILFKKVNNLIKIIKKFKFIFYYIYIINKIKIDLNIINAEWKEKINELNLQHTEEISEFE